VLAALAPAGSARRGGKLAHACSGIIALLPHSPLIHLIQCSLADLLPFRLREASREQRLFFSWGNSCLFPTNKARISHEQRTKDGGATLAARGTQRGDEPAEEAVVAGKILSSSVACGGATLSSWDAVFLVSSWSRGKRLQEVGKLVGNQCNHSECLRVYSSTIQTWPPTGPLR